MQQNLPAHSHLWMWSECNLKTKCWAHSRHSVLKWWMKEEWMKHFIINSYVILYHYWTCNWLLENMFFFFVLSMFILTDNLPLFVLQVYVKETAFLNVKDITLLHVTPLLKVFFLTVNCAWIGLQNKEYRCFCSLKPREQ